MVILHRVYYIGLKNNQLTSALIHVYPMVSTNLYGLDLAVRPKDLNPILAFIKADSHISCLTLLVRGHNVPAL